MTTGVAFFFFRIEGEAGREGKQQWEAVRSNEKRKEVSVLASKRQQRNGNHRNFHSSRMKSCASHDQESNHPTTNDTTSTHTRQPVFRTSVEKVDDDRLEIKQGAEAVVVDKRHHGSRGQRERPPCTDHKLDQYRNQSLGRESARGVSVCVRACVRACVRVFVRAHVCACVCVRACVRAREVTRSTTPLAS